MISCELIVSCSENIPHKTTGITAESGISGIFLFLFEHKTIMWKACFAVAFGSALGGVLRWWLGLRLNTLQTPFPIGTFAANLIAAFLIGLFLAFFISHPKIPAEYKLLLTTGLCGGLSTFSTFSAEMFALFEQQRYHTALLGIASHLVGSFIMTALGFATWHTAKRYMT